MMETHYSESALTCEFKLPWLAPACASIPYDSINTLILARNSNVYHVYLQRGIFEKTWNMCVER